MVAWRSAQPALFEGGWKLDGSLLSKARFTRVSYGWTPRLIANPNQSLSLKSRNLIRLNLVKAQARTHFCEVSRLEARQRVPLTTYYQVLKKKKNLNSPRHLILPCYTAPQP